MEEEEEDDDDRRVTTTIEVSSCEVGASMWVRTYLCWLVDGGTRKL